MKKQLSFIIYSICFLMYVAHAQDSKPNVKPKTTTKPATTAKPPDIKSQSKQETIDWILEKFNKYASDDREIEKSNLNDKYAIKYYSWKTNYFDRKYSIDNNYFIVEYKQIISDYNGDKKIYIQRDNFSENKLIIPIYAISSVSKYKNELTINTNSNEIKNEGFYVNGSKKNPLKFKNSYLFIPFSFYEEDDLDERLNKAFMNLKKYYPPPVNTEKF